VRHSPLILLSTTNCPASICSSITTSCHSLCLDDLVYPSFFGCLAIYDLAVPSSPNRSPPFVKFDVGTTQASPLKRYFQVNVSHLLFRWTCSFDGKMTIDLPPGC
ncbi:hypothetical protein P692DRAFT_20889572, partial [Suillus brevipes Sb2]